MALSSAAQQPQHSWTKPTAAAVPSPQPIQAAGWAAARGISISSHLLQARSPERASAATGQEGNGRGTAQQTPSPHPSAVEGGTGYVSGTSQRGPTWLRPGLQIPPLWAEQRTHPQDTGHFCDKKSRRHPFGSRGPEWHVRGGWNTEAAPRL